ncbi:hypothetical protein GCM10018963_74180 [Saccharothrix longispora]
MATSSTKSAYTRLRVTAQSTWKKSQANVLVAWACRNRRQEVSVSRRGGRYPQALEHAANR